MEQEDGALQWASESLLTHSVILQASVFPSGMRSPAPHMSAESCENQMLVSTWKALSSTFLSGL